jgi:anaerobic magnesium-protoporphyrin IX monomethyl ester cyclase
VKATTILYNPVSSRGRKPVLPLSLLALGAAIEGDHDYLIVDGNLESEPLDALDRAIAETNARVLAVTVMPGPQLRDAVPVCRELKSRHPRLRVVWGGYFPTEHAEACLRSPFVDHVIRGHGEEVFRTCLRTIDEGGDPALSPGVSSRSPRGEVILAPQAREIPDPEELPDFPYFRIDLPRYIRPTFMGLRTVAHHSSYGCPHTCNFCGVVSLAGGRWRAQSAARAAATAERLAREWGADSVEFYDNNFFAQESRAAEFAERILNLRLGWWAQGRIDSLLRFTDRTWALLRDSGLRMVFLGAESGSDETLRRMNKGGATTTAMALDLAGRMRGLGIVPEFSFVLGTPPDPEQDATSTMALIRRLKQVNPNAEIVLYLYTPVPVAGELYDQVRSVGFHFPETLEEWIAPSWQEFAERRGRRLPWLRGSTRSRVRDFERVLNAYYPTVTDPKLTGLRRGILKMAGGWRYHLGIYRFSVELRLFQKVFAYQRPETSGF